MITLNEIRQNLISAIKESGLSQTEIAQRLCVKQPTVAQYLSGKAMPALDTFANLCVILDVDPADILCTNDKKTSVKNQSYTNNGTHNGDVNFK